MNKYKNTFLHIHRQLWQLLYFYYKTNAQSGCFDDTVMAAAILLQLLLEGKGESFIPEVPIDQRGGKREGAGRKPIAEELKARDTFLKAIKEYYK